MQLHLESDDYRKLIELAYLGEWLINAHHDPEHQDDSSTGTLQKLLAAARLEGIDRDVETGNYFLESSWTDRLYDRYILDYDDHVFWDELTERLAQRDLARKRGVPVEDINRDDDLTQLRPLEDHYRHELELRGIERLDISEGF